MAQLIMIRHGQTQWNEQRRMQGHSDSPLNDTGLRQAQMLGRRLVQTPFTALYSSDSGRAHHTARIVAEATGHTITVDCRLRERHFGVFEGLNREEIEARYPEAYTRFKDRDVEYAIPGGESALVFRDRVLGCLHEIADRHGDECVVIITHGLVLDVAYRMAMGIAFEERRLHNLVNAGINQFRCHAGAWQVEIWADGSHLEAQLLTST